MPFDIASAKPVTSGGFDLSSAKPVGSIPASVSQKEEGLESGGPFAFLSDFAYESGSRTAETLAKGGASPEFAAVAGTLGNITAQAVPMVTGGIGTGLVKGAGKLVEGGKSLIQKAIEGGKGVASTLRGKPAEQAAAALKGEVSSQLSGAQKNLMQQAVKETTAMGDITGAKTSALHKVQAKKSAGIAEDSALQEKLLADRNAHKEVWEKDVMAKESAGHKIQDTPEFKNVVNLIDDRIKKYAGNKTAESTLNGIKAAITSPNFAGLDVERQAMGSKAYRDSLSPELQNTAKDIHRALTNAMGKYSDRYGKMLTEWGEGKAKSELLEETNKKLERQVSAQTKRVAESQKVAAKAKEKAVEIGKKYESEIIKIDAITESKEIAPQALSIAKKMLSDGTIDATKYRELNDKIGAVEKLYGQTEHYRKAMKWVLGTVVGAGVYETIHHF